MKYCLKDCTIRGAWAVVALAALASCDSDLRELCYDHNHKAADLQVRFDWRDNPDAQPASMA